MNIALCVQILRIGNSNVMTNVCQYRIMSVILGRNLGEVHMPISIGEVVKNLRKERGLSQRDLSAESNGEVNKNWLASLEKGHIANLSLNLLKVRLIVPHQHHVIHVANIHSPAQLLLDELIQLIQVDVGEQLARKIPNGNTLAGVAIPRINDAVDQTKRSRARDVLPQNLL